MPFRGKRTATSPISLLTRRASTHPVQQKWQRPLRNGSARDQSFYENGHKKHMNSRVLMRFGTLLMKSGSTPCNLALSKRSLSAAEGRFDGDAQERPQH